MGLLPYSPQGWAQRGCLRGWGHFRSKGMNRTAEAVSKGEYEGGWTPHSLKGGLSDLTRIFFLKIYVSENVFQVILKPNFSIFYNLNFK